MFKQWDHTYLQYLAKHVIRKPVERWHVVVGMSGGVDSSVSAYLCKQQNFAHVSGIFMQNWDSKDEVGDVACPVEQDWLDVKQTCEQLQMPCKRKEFVRQYWNNVFENTLEEYAQGKTPNPDVWCNRFIKFDALLQHVQREMQADILVTGHYARLLPAQESAVNLAKAMDLSKDQSYFLAMVKHEAFQRSWFPLGHVASKRNVVRQIAKDAKLQVAEKEESMGICFIGERKFDRFLSQYLTSKPAKFVTHEGVEMPFPCKGIAHYTIGQSCKLPGLQHKWFVYDKDLHQQIIYICPGTNHPALFCSQFTVKDVYWIHNTTSAIPESCTVKIRYNQQHAVPCTLKLHENGSSLCVQMEAPMRAVTPGQIAVFYHGDICLGGAIIDAKT